jgi:hypothetical protein
MCVLWYITRLPFHKTFYHKQNNYGFFLYVYSVVLYKISSTATIYKLMFTCLCSVVSHRTSSNWKSLSKNPVLYNLAQTRSRCVIQLQSPAGVPRSWSNVRSSAFTNAACILTWAERVSRRRSLHHVLQDVSKVLLCMEIPSHERHISKGYHL